MKAIKRVAFGIAIAAGVLILLGASGAAVLYWKFNAGTKLASAQNIWDSIYWRGRLYLKKAGGGVPDLSWADLLEMTSDKGGHSLEYVITENLSVWAAVSNPYDSPEDLQAGEHIFRERCAVCHGSDATGLHGPPLNRPGLRNGDSNLALYKVLKYGVPDTSMVATGLSAAERWQVIAFLRPLQRISGAAGIDKVETRRLDIQVSSQEIQSPESRPGEWLSYSGSLNGWRFAPLNEITPENVSQLRTRWVHQFTTNATTELRFESTPLVVDGVIFMTAPPASVVALDARTGETIWEYQRRLSDVPNICCGKVNRGVAILGSTLFFGSVDGNLVAIDANNGKEIWQTQVVNPSDHFSLTGAPLVVNRSVIVGVSGGEFGISGFLAAFDVATGERQWKFDTIPGPGSAGHETWENDAWKNGGGPTWVTGSYDPSLDLLFWGVGNPTSDFSGAGRPGDNLFTESVIALHASSGKLAWYFQFTPHDEHDWDRTQTPILADVLINGTSRKVICWANRNGFYYVLDRLTGEFLAGVPFVEQNWAKGLDAAGRPILSDVSEATKTGRLTKPSAAGGVNWQPSAFDPRQSLFFVHATEGTSVFTKAAVNQIKPGGKTGDILGSGAAVAGPLVPMVRALDAATGVKRWEYPSPKLNESDYSGLLATAGGVIFGASGGILFALDAATGHELWRMPLGGRTVAPPISFTLDGRQVIAVMAGRALIAFGL